MPIPLKSGKGVVIAGVVGEITIHKMGVEHDKVKWMLKFLQIWNFNPLTISMKFEDLDFLHKTHLDVS